MFSTTTKWFLGALAVVGLGGALGLTVLNRPIAGEEGMDENIPIIQMEEMTILPEAGTATTGTATSAAHRVKTLPGKKRVVVFVEPLFVRGEIASISDEAAAEPPSY
jgi:hypothetical protein